MSTRCENCQRDPQYGNNRPWSKKATRRRWNLNVQKVKVLEQGRMISKNLCTNCIRTLGKVTG
ncbi:MAG: 50S ribosomal protein L28 [Caldilineaceae bacterium]